MTLYLVYECDTWLSTLDRQLVAVCDNMESVESLLIRYPYCSMDQAIEVRESRQSQCGNLVFRNNFIVEEITMNELLIE